MRRRALAIAFLLALVAGGLALGDWAQGQGFIRTTTTTTAGGLPSDDGWLTVSQIRVSARADSTGGSPWTVTLTRNGATFHSWELYPGMTETIDYPGGKRMKDLVVSVIDQPSTTGEVVVVVEHQ